jgi:hypothetical protein
VAKHHTSRDIGIGVPDSVAAGRELGPPAEVPRVESSSADRPPVPPPALGKTHRSMGAAPGLAGTQRPGTLPAAPTMGPLVVPQGPRSGGGFPQAGPPGLFPHQPGPFPQQLRPGPLAHFPPAPAMIPPSHSFAPPAHPAQVAVPEPIVPPPPPEPSSPAPRIPRRTEGEA